MDKAGQEFRADTKTLDSQGRLSVCGYFWRTTRDTIQMKPVKITNGRKVRGKISPPKGVEFLFEKFTTVDQMTPNFVNKILKDITKTLRVMVSLAGQP